MRRDVANLTTGTTGATIGSTTATTTDGQHLKGRNTLGDNPVAVCLELNYTVRSNAVGDAAGWSCWTEAVTGLATSDLATKCLTANERSLRLLNQLQRRCGSSLDCNLSDHFLRDRRGHRILQRVITCITTDCDVREGGNTANRSNGVLGDLVARLE